MGLDSMLWAANVRFVTGNCMCCVTAVGRRRQLAVEFSVDPKPLVTNARYREVCCDIAHAALVHAGDGKVA